MKQYMKLSLGFALLLIIMSPTLYAQGGSNYSALGYGDFNNFGNAASAGVNGLSIAFPNSTSLNLKNPALWSEITTTRLNLGYWFNQNSVKSENSSLWQNNGSVNGFTAAINIDTVKGITLGLGLVPKTLVRYYIATPVEINQDGISAKGNTYYRGEGGLSEAFMGMSAKLFDRVSLGISGNFTFGSITRYTQSLFYDDLTLYAPKTTTKDYLWGWGGKAGAMVNIGHGFRVGAVYELGTSLNYESDLAYFGVNSASDTVVERTGMTTKLPISIGTGISYKKNRWTVGFDYITQNFSDLDYNFGTDSKFRAANQYVLGFSLDSKNRPRNYYDKIAWRAGAAYRDLYYSVNNQNIGEYSISAGASLPAGQTLMFDIGIVLGNRGTTSNQLVRENFGRLFVDFSIGEIWFKKYERDYNIEED